MTRFAAIACLILPTVGLAADDPSVPSYPRGGPARAGAYPGVTPIARPKTDWIASLGPSGGSPTVDPDLGLLVVGNSSDSVIAASLKDGEQVWAVKAPGWRVYQPPLIAGGRIFCASDRDVSALGLDGSRLWSKGIDGGAGGSPLLVGDVLFVAGDDGFAYGLDPRDGKERWKTDIVADAPPDPKGFDGARARIGGTKARPSGAASDGKSAFLAIFDQSRVVALDLATGARRWSFQAEGWIAGEPTYGDGKVFVGSQDKKVYALDAADGRKLWEFATRWRADGEIAFADGSVFVAASDGRCYRIDAGDGHQVWGYETPVGPDGKHFFLSGAPLVDAGAVYFGSWDGHLYALDRADGAVRWTHKPARDGEHVHAPITDGRRLIVPISPAYDFDAQRDKDGVHGFAAIGPAD